MTSLPATVITYPSGATRSTGSVVLLADAGEGRTAVVLDATAFHPVDTAWPDQPADHGVLRAGGRSYEIVDAVVGATEGDVVLIGDDIPVRTGTDGWTFVVAHLVAHAELAVGDVVEVEADAAYRAALSAGHTGCHLASLALDAALAGAWRKEVPVDAIGAPAFDSLAISQSRILPDGSRDLYRIGKSLRRKGFDPSTTSTPWPRGSTRSWPTGSPRGALCASKRPATRSRTVAPGCASSPAAMPASRAAARTSARCPTWRA